MKRHFMKWYSGKSRERAEAAFDLLLQSEKEGQWLPKASRSVPAALGKCNVAIRVLTDEVLASLARIDEDLAQGYLLGSAIRFGYFPRLLGIDIDRLRKLAKTEDQISALQIAATMHKDFIEVAQLIATLNATKPAPTFTNLGVSPTITKTLGDSRLDLDPSTVRICPHEFFRVLEKEGWVHYMRLLWPKGTAFEKSRFAYRSHQCHSCGHTIRNPFNWVPLLIDNHKGVPHSLWVGRDCAARIFGIKVTGEILIEGGKK